MKSRNAKDYDDENYDEFEDDSSNRFDDLSDGSDATNADGLNYTVVGGDAASYDPDLDPMQLDLYNLDGYGEEVSPEDDDFDDDFDEDFINLSDDDSYEAMFPEERVSDGDEPADAAVDPQVDEEIDEFDDLNADENVYGGEEEL